MKTLVPIATFFLLSTLAPAAPGDIEYNERVFTLGGVEYVTQMPNTAPEPLWNPELEALPLSVEDAFKLANQHFQKTFGDQKDFRFQSIGLQRWGDGQDHRFLYLIVFMQDLSKAEPIKLPDGGNQRIPLNIVYYVSLDGTLYPPRPKGG